jgi:hypothetical protein
MSAGVSPLSGAGPLVLFAERPAAHRPAVAFSPEPLAAPSPPLQPAPSDPSGALRLPDEQAFKIATINERLASLAASADTARRIDLTA